VIGVRLSGLVHRFLRSVFSTLNKKPMHSFIAQKTLLLLCLAAAPAVSYANIYFSNTGTSSGWDQIYIEHNGSATQVSSPVYHGSTAMRMRQVYDSSYTGRYHCELRADGLTQMGNDRYYSFAFYLPSNWQFVDQNFNLEQFIGTPSCGTTGQPWTMVWVRNNALSTRTTTGPDGCTRTDTNYTVTSNVTAGTWHRVVMRGRWRSDTTGLFQFWYDGSKVIDQQNIATCPNSTTAMQYAVGCYANGWHDNATMLGTQSTRDVYIDSVRCTTTYAEADPAQW
jgi:hypothetical protein